MLKLCYRTDPAAIAALLPPGIELPLVDFLQNGLTDPRVAARAFPFDRPVLAAPEPATSWQLGAGLAALLGLRAARSRRRGR